MQDNGEAGTEGLTELLGNLGNFESATKKTPLDQLKLAIIGAPKSGKSRLAATCRKPALLYDFDGRAASVAGTPGLEIKTLVDTNNMNPQAYAEFSANVGQLEYHKEQHKSLPIKTVILDSITYMMQAAMYQSMANTKGATTLTVGGRSVRVPRGYDNYEGEKGLILTDIVRLFYLGIDVIACFHERPEEAPGSTQENPKFTGKVTVHPPRAVMLLPLFNELWRVKAESAGIYRVQVKPDYDFTAATCLSNLSEVEESNIEAMIKKHLGGSR